MSAAEPLADPGACGACRSRVAAGQVVKHDGCAQRATLLEAPDQPGYEELLDLTDEQRRSLPPRFHTPQFDRDGVPAAWLCRVCWGDGWVTRWPCATAAAHGGEVFTADHLAERAHQELAAEVERLRAELAARPSRAEVLREAADVYDGLLTRYSVAMADDPRYLTGVHHVVTGLRNLAAEADATETPRPSPAACCSWHRAPVCCDPEDCGPCCERCPTCPTLARARTAPADAPGAGEGR